MGCLNSKGADSSSHGFSSSARDTESQVNLILKAKQQRANVFTQGLKPDDNFKIKFFSKSDKQKEIISKIFNI